MLLVYPLAVIAFTAVSSFYHGLFTLPPVSDAFTTIFSALLLPACSTTAQIVLIMGANPTDRPFAGLHPDFESRLAFGHALQHLCPNLESLALRNQSVPEVASSYEYVETPPIVFRVDDAHYSVDNALAAANHQILESIQSPCVDKNGLQVVHGFECDCIFFLGNNSIPNDEPLVSFCSNYIFGEMTSVTRLSFGQLIQTVLIASRSFLSGALTFIVIAGLQYLRRFPSKAAITSSRKAYGVVESTANKVDTIEKGRTSMNVLRDFAIRVKDTSGHMNGSLAESLGLFPRTEFSIPTVPGLSIMTPSASDESPLASFNESYLHWISTRSTKSFDLSKKADTSLYSNTTAIKRPRDCLSVDLKNEKCTSTSNLEHGPAAISEPTVAKKNDPASFSFSFSPPTSNVDSASSVSSFSSLPTASRKSEVKKIKKSSAFSFTFRPPPRRASSIVSAIPCPRADVANGSSCPAPSFPVPSSLLITAVTPESIEVKAPAPVFSLATVGNALSGPDALQHESNKVLVMPTELSTTHTMDTETTTEATVLADDPISPSSESHDESQKGKVCARDTTEEVSEPAIVDDVIAPPSGVEADINASLVRTPKGLSERSAQPHFDFGAIRSLVESTAATDVANGAELIANKKLDMSRVTILTRASPAMKASLSTELGNEESKSTAEAGSGSSGNERIEKPTVEGPEKDESPSTSRRKKPNRRRTCAQLQASKLRRQELGGLPFTDCQEDSFRALVNDQSA